MLDQSVHATISPLRRIFWGGLLCIFDLSFSQTINGEGFKFDILNDAVGTFLIALGVFRLSEFSVHERYASVMKFAKIVSVFAVLNAIRDHFIVPLPSAIYFVLNVFGLIRLVAIVAFCIAMRWLCEAAQLPNSVRQSWRLTTTLFVVIYLIPLGLFYLAAALAIATNSKFNLDLGPLGILALPVFAIPVIHLFMSTSRMKESAEAVLS